MPGWLLPFAISTGASLLGRKLLGGTPKVPDLTQGVEDTYEASRARLQNQIADQRDATLGDLSRRRAEMEGSLAAAGLTGSGTIPGMVNLFRGNAGMLNSFNRSATDAMLGLQAAEDAAINDAKQRQALMNYEAEMMKKQNQYQGLSDIISSGTNMYMMSKLFGGDEGGGGFLSRLFGGGGTPTNVPFELLPPMPSRAGTYAPAGQMFGLPTVNVPVLKNRLSE